MSPEDIQNLQDRIVKLEQIINLLVKPDSYVFERPLKAGANGLKIGVSGNKMSVYGVMPIAKQAAITGPTGGGTIDSQARTAINTIITTLQNFGITS